MCRVNRAEANKSEIKDFLFFGGCWGLVYSLRFTQLEYQESSTDKIGWVHELGITSYSL